MEESNRSYFLKDVDNILKRANDGLRKLSRADVNDDKELKLLLDKVSDNLEDALRLTKFVRDTKLSK